MEATAVLQKTIENAEELDIRLEVVGGLTIWEAQPVAKHQKAVMRIGRSINPRLGSDGRCGCYWLPDVYIQFPEGSLKRPDISIFCREPEQEDEPITLLPEAVIEIISKTYEAKDEKIGAPFFIEQGIKDVVLLNPYTGMVTHKRRDGEMRYSSPVEIELECGCVCTV